MGVFVVLLASVLLPGYSVVPLPVAVIFLLLAVGAVFLLAVFGCLLLSLSAEGLQFLQYPHPSD